MDNKIKMPYISSQSSSVMKFIIPPSRSFACGNRLEHAPSFVQLVLPMAPRWSSMESQAHVRHRGPMHAHGWLHPHVGGRHANHCTHWIPHVSSWWWTTYHVLRMHWHGPRHVMAHVLLRRERLCRGCYIGWPTYCYVFSPAGVC
jgi:hypothetical protein